MASLVIFGASGFLGRALIATEAPWPIKAVSRAVPSDASLRVSGVTWVEADLLDRGSVAPILGAGDVVVNLAYIASGTEADNLRVLDNLIDACVNARVRRLVHCSTAVVVGATRDARIDESTPCVPLTPYERTKWALEQRIGAAAANGLDAAILRPTAIVGRGGKNLLSLARSLREGSRAVSYLRASLFGKRVMHLVPARDVAAAVIHVAALPGSLHGDVFIVSSDDDPSNSFQTVEGLLSDALGLPRRSVPQVVLPPGVLALLLRVRGRSETRLDRIYSSDKLRSTGFRSRVTIADAVREFGESIRNAS